ncbi:MAG: hypothetical protein M0Z67_08940 [Nitrospiraceae bacterium]|nr:hypothetical protein [Nitrospiraceae bacterium]
MTKEKLDKHSRRKGSRTVKKRSLTLLTRLGITVGIIYFIAGVFMIRLNIKSYESFHGWIYYWDGPYQGKVVELETGAPIEGAVVAGSWNLEVNFGWPMFCDAVETLTDKNGEFTLPRAWCINPWPLGRISLPGNIVVFKPGYLAYPPMGSTEPDRKKYMPSWNNPPLFEGSKQNNVVELGKPGTKEERKLTNDSVHSPLAFDKAYRKLPFLLGLINEDRKALGLQGEIGIPKRGGY